MIRCVSLLLLLAGCASTPLTTVVVVRHAEKQNDGSKDPELTALGETRAERLAAMLSQTEPAAIYATQYRRTQDTVRPLAERTRTPMTTVDAGATAELAKRILANHPGQTVVVAGHSNTVNRLIAALGGPTFPDLKDPEYDNIFILTVGGDRTKLLPLRFGLTGEDPSRDPSSQP